MTYQALYRKWRPLSFDEVIGQEHVTTIISRSAESGRLAHAYLFCGPRGTGKTSSARILAKILNCEGKTKKPCNDCDTCKQITAGSFLDVIEIDAASHTGVDDIRELREAAVTASTGKKKVYIIDEVHMLSKAAFNALLKLIEEPPAHVVFVLATTEPHKVPATIISRCQRFDFFPIGAEQMVKTLLGISKREKIDIEPAAIEIIAGHSQGSMRDALSILEQISSYSTEKITADTVNKMLGATPHEQLSRAVKAVIGRNPVDAITLVASLISKGIDLRQFLKDLHKYLRNLALAANSKSIDKSLLLDCPGTVISQLESEAKILGPENSLILTTKLFCLLRDMSKSYDDRLFAESVLFDLQSIKKEPAVTRPEAVTLREVPAAVKQVEKIPTPKKQPDNLWPEILMEVKKLDRKVHSLLVECSPASMENNTLRLMFNKRAKFHMEKASLPESKKIITEAAQTASGKKMDIECFLETQTQTQQVKDNDKIIKLDHDAQSLEKHDKNNDDLLGAVISDFEAELID